MASTDTRIIRKVTHEGDRALRWTARRFAEDFRAQRTRLGLTQAAVARSIGVTRSVISRIEAGDADVGARIRARACAVLGATYKMALYPDAEPMIRDAAHARLIETLLRLREPGWRATLEAPVPSTRTGPARRSTDVRLDGAGQIVLCEVETRIERWEELAREAHDKRAAVQEGAPPGVRVHAVLVLPPTHQNRAVVRALPETVRAAFPANDRALHEALAIPPGPWPGDGILWLPAGRPGNPSGHPVAEEHRGGACAERRRVQPPVGGDQRAPRPARTDDVAGVRDPQPELESGLGRGRGEVAGVHPVEAKGFERPHQGGDRCRLKVTGTHSDNQRGPNLHREVRRLSRFDQPRADPIAQDQRGRPIRLVGQ